MFVYINTIPFVVIWITYLLFNSKDTTAVYCNIKILDIEAEEK